MTTTLFGKPQNTLGSSNTDLILKTKGNIKIQFGNKFIDLFKNGKINTDIKIAYQVNSIDDIGVRDGIYVVGSGDIYLKLGNSIIGLTTNSSNSYVSFVAEQETTSEQKYQALVNIGFIYNKLSDIDNTCLKNGIIYIEETQKLYIVKNGQITEFTVSFPNPFTKQFIIAKDDNTIGSLIIQGLGLANGIIFEKLQIYNDKDKSVFNFLDGLYFQVAGTDIIRFTNQGIYSDVPIITQSIQSSTSSNTGWRIYISATGESILEIDRIEERNKDSYLQFYPEYWLGENYIIKSSEYLDSDTEIVNGYEQTYYRYSLELTEDITAYTGDVFTAYDIYLNDAGVRTITLRVFYVMQTTAQDNTLIVKCYTERKSTLENQILFKIRAASGVFHPIRINNSSVEYVSYDANLYKEYIYRCGSLAGLGFSKRVNGELVSITEEGIYSKFNVFKQACYNYDYQLPIEDNSTNLVPTEWIHKLLPKGSIIMFNGEEIPEGWHICDGTEGTPNLIGKFIKADSAAGNTGGKNTVTLTIDNLPPHRHSLETTTAYTSTDGQHSHNYTDTGPVLGAEGEQNVQGGESYQAATTLGGQHSHTIDLSDITLTSVGSGESINIEPSYYTLIYIMKII